MTIPAIFSDGTISIDAGGTTVTGAGTAFSTQARYGSLLIVGDTIGVVASNPDSDDEQDYPQDLEIELISGWPGDAVADASYLLVTFRAGADLASDFLTLWSRLSGKGLGTTTVGPPDPSLGRDNDFAWDPVTNTLYFKVTGAWQAFSIRLRFDAYSSDGPRGDYDDEDAGFTWFDEDNEVWYVRRTATFGTWAGPFQHRGPRGGDRYDIGVDDPGKPTSGETLRRWLCTTEITFDTGLLESRAKVAAAPGSEQVFSLRKNGVEFGTCTFAMGETDGTFASGAPAVFAAGDVFSVVAPDPADPSLTEPLFTVTGYRPTS